MLSVIDLAKKIKGNRCEKLVKYMGQEYVISGANVGVGSFKSTLVASKTKSKKSMLSQRKVSQIKNLFFGLP